jgi:hypothetical protein
LVDCEISFGLVTAHGFQITASTLPYRRNQLMSPRLGDSTLTTRDRDSRGEPERHWDITELEGDAAALHT